jgi:hypothetical protein
MTRQKLPSLIEAMENASFSFRCNKGHEFWKTGAWLRRNLIFRCPKCVGDDSTFVHTEAVVEHLLNDRIDRLRKMIDHGSGGVTPKPKSKHSEPPVE